LPSIPVESIVSGTYGISFEDEVLEDHRIRPCSVWMPGRIADADVIKVLQSVGPVVADVSRVVWIAIQRKSLSRKPSETAHNNRQRIRTRLSRRL